MRVGHETSPCGRAIPSLEELAVYPLPLPRRLLVFEGVDYRREQCKHRSVRYLRRGLRGTDCLCFALQLDKSKLSRAALHQLDAQGGRSDSDEDKVMFSMSFPCHLNAMGCMRIGQCSLSPLRVSILSLLFS